MSLWCRSPRVVVATVGVCALVVAIVAVWARVNREVVRADAGGRGGEASSAKGAKPVSKASPEGGPAAKAASGAASAKPSESGALQGLAAPVLATQRRMDWPFVGEAAMRGVTVGPIESSQQPGRGYGTAYTAALLDHLRRMGVNWISITPFGRLWSLKSTEIVMDFEMPYEQNREAVKTMVRQAKARGIRVLVIPHLWIETDGWRGEVDPGTPARWAAYKASYRRFVLAWARDAAEAGADAFSVGVECKSWSNGHERSWSALIADVRKVFPGMLTYSANWDEAQDVVFWHELDAIGINAFYPLADHNKASDDEYRRRARQNVEGVEELARLFDKPVVFVEIGYTTRTDAAVEPWLWPDNMKDVQVDEREQARALAASLEAIVPKAWFAGFFVWRYYANLDDISQEAVWGFSPHGKQADALLSEVFAVRFGSDPEPWPWTRSPIGARRSTYPFDGLFALPDGTSVPHALPR